MTTPDDPIPVSDEPGWGTDSLRPTIRGVLALAAAALFIWAGVSMLSLRSVGGNTVAELFDNYVGIFCLGMAALTLLIAAPKKDA